MAQTPNTEKNVNTIQIYTDGGYFEKSKTGGWAGVIYIDHAPAIELSDAQKCDSSLHMELLAAVNSLEHLAQLPLKQARVQLFTDSRIMIEGLSQKIDLWRQQKWQAKSGNPIRFRSLWEKLADLKDRFNVEFCWVKGHNGQAGNELADQLARAAVLNLHPTQCA